MLSAELLRDLTLDPKSVLNRGYKANVRKRAREEKLRYWRDMSEQITVNYEGMPGGKGFPGSRTEISVEHISELCDMIAQDIQELVQYELDAYAIIGALCHSANRKMVLELRFVNYKTAEEISAETGYTFRWTQELIKRALVEVQLTAAKMLKDRFMQ